MKHGIKLMAAAIIGLIVASCSSVSKMAEMAENVKVESNPAVLEVIAGKIDATVSVTYPSKYFHPKAILEVTPVIVYDGGEAKMEPFMYQGSKVKDNYTVVSSEGQTVTEKVHFDYVEGMEKARLELRGVVKYKKKTVNLPVKKVADGCNTTYMLVEKDAYVPMLKDDYQEIIKQTAEGQILYSINSSDVRAKELKSKSIKDFQSALDEIKKDDRKTITGTEVVAYASPDGGEELNQKLSKKRSETADKAFSSVTKGKDVSKAEVKSIGQDWEGFQSLVSKSGIEDRDLIIRVLNMYSDPAVREREIKNMSQIYTSLKSNVLPELRRARFIANVEYKNFTAQELNDLVNENIDVLDEEALLRAASLTKKAEDKINIYNHAISKFDSDRALFNLGVVYLEKGDAAKAEEAFNKVQNTGAELDNAKGAVALMKGDYNAASALFKKSGTDAAKQNQAIIDILSGNYTAAAKALEGKKGFNPALAQLLVKNNDKALSALTCQCPRSNYLRAVIYARKGDAENVAKYLDLAKKDQKYAARAEKDIEFAQYK